MSKRCATERFSRFLMISMDAFAGLINNQQRSMLALLGIAIGCSTIITVLNIGEAASQASASVFKDLGSDLIAATFPMDPPPADHIDTTELLKELPTLNRAAPVALYSTSARSGRRYAQVTIAATTPAFFHITQLAIHTGRLPSPFDSSAPYIVLGANIAASLGETSSLKARDSVQIEGYYFKVIGTLLPHGLNPLISIDYDNSIFINIDGLRRLRHAPLSSIIAEIHKGENSEQCALDLKENLAGKLPKTSIEALSPTQLLAGAETQANIFTYLLGGMGFISLIAGGIGIMNVMLMSVTERRREIGTRIALGARPSDIGLLFLMEAIFLASLGSTAGTLMGMAGSAVFMKLSGWSMIFTPLSFAIGVASSLATGVFFGLHPALTAARLPPVKALRDE